MASVFEPPTEVRWHAILGGGTIVDVAFVKSGTGVSQAFKAALQTQRVLWLTDAFMDSHRDLARGLVNRMGNGHGGCQWRLAQDRAHFLQRAGKDKNKAILLCLQGEKADACWAGVKHKFDLMDAIGFLEHVVPERSTAGVCGR